MYWSVVRWPSTQVDAAGEPGQLVPGQAGAELANGLGQVGFAQPLPVVLHVLSASVYCALGAFQFAPGFRRRRPGWGSRR